MRWLAGPELQRLLVFQKLEAIDAIFDPIHRCVIGCKKFDCYHVSETGDRRGLTAANIERWRIKVNDPLSDPTLVEVYQAAARSAEAIYATVTARRE